MYQIIDAAKSNVQEYTMSGTIDGVAFSGENNIVSGSCNYQNQCSDTSNFNLGYVYTGIFSATFINININRNDWTGLEIVPIVHIGNINVPVGHFFISEADHKAGVVAVKAKDAMEKFKKAAAISTGSNGKPYDFLMLACQNCGVTLGMTQAQVEALPNGNLAHALEEMGDIEDWIDVIYWVSQQLGGFATINRNGKLVVRTYHNTVDDTMPADVRFNSAYGDEIITYTGLQVVNTGDQKTEYYHAQVDNGYNVKLGSNPFMQVSLAQRKVYCENLITALGNISYNSFDVSIPFGCHYDLGDVLSFPNGDGDADNLFCIMYISWTFGGECKLKGIPKPSKSMSKTDKNLQGLLSMVDKNEFQDYEQKNTRKITIGNNTEERILMAKLASNNTTKALIHLEINLVSKAVAITDKVDVDVTAEQDETTGVITASGTAEGSDIFSLVSSKTTKGIVRYLVNSEEAGFRPIEQWLDGNHVLHLMFVLGLYQGIPATFEVYMKAQGGTIEIPMGGMWFYGSGRGLVGDGKWDGNIEVQEYAPEFDFIELGFEDAYEELSVDTLTPTAISLRDTVADWNIVELSFEDATDTLYVNLYTETFVRVTEDGETTRITEDGSVRYTEGD